MSNMERRTVIEAVTFDLWQTLIYETDEQEDRRRRLRYKRMKGILRGKVDFSYDAFLKAHDEVWEKCMELWKTNRDMSAREQATLFLDCLMHEKPVQSPESEVQSPNQTGLPPDSGLRTPDSGLWTLDSGLSKIEHAYTDVILDDIPLLFEGAKEVLEELSRRGIRIGLICNTGRTPGRCLREVLGRLGIVDYFDVLAFSDETLVRKPDPRAFIMTLEKLAAARGQESIAETPRLHPARTLHVGDNPVADVQGAKAAGMYAVHILRGENPEPSPDADACIKDLRELSRVLEMLARK